MFFCFADPHFKRVNFRRRIINASLLTEYAYVLKDGGKIYTVTDVKDLYDWNVEYLGKHPLFEEVLGEEKDNDPCVRIMKEETNEAKKVIKRGDPVWAAVFRKKSVKDEKEIGAYFS
jgi:tRNA (guanine-N7-)-methyltransferase